MHWSLLFKTKYIFDIIDPEKYGKESFGLNYLIWDLKIF